MKSYKSYAMFIVYCYLIYLIISQPMTYPTTSRKIFKKYTIVYHKQDYPYVVEYISSNFSDNQMISYDATTTFEVGTYLFIRRIPILEESTPPPKYEYFIMYNEESPRIPKGSTVAFLNIEQLTDIVTLNYLQTYLHKKIRYFDYSRENIFIMQRGRLISYRENREETERLRLYCKIDQQVDICLVGSLTTRRKKILEQLENLGYLIDVITDEFGDDRDQRIGWAKLLLNIHARDKWTVYESIRCERWRFAGKKIVSEQSLYIPDGIIQCPYEDLVETVQRELR